MVDRQRGVKSKFLIATSSIEQHGHKNRRTASGARTTGPLQGHTAPRGRVASNKLESHFSFSRGGGRLAGQQRQTKSRCAPYPKAGVERPSRSSLRAIE